MSDGLTLPSHTQTVWQYLGAEITSKQWLTPWTRDLLISSLTFWLYYQSYITFTTLDGLIVEHWTNNRKVVGSTPDRVAIKQLLLRWVTVYLQTGKPSWYITNTNVTSAFHPSGVNKSSTSLSGWGWNGARAPVSSGS